MNRRTKHELQSIREMESLGYRLLKRDELAKTMDKLERRGLIERRKLPYTAKGRRIMKQLKGTYMNVYSR